MLRDKKAEIGEAITWVVATLIIIVVLIIFIFASGVLGKYKSINVGEGPVNVVYDSNFKTKTADAFNLNFTKKVQIENWINEIKDNETELGSYYYVK